MAQMTILDQITTWITVISGLNWGLVGIANMDVVEWIGTAIKMPIISKIIYILVGLCALYVAYRGLNKFN